jgi:hypothetical protein
VHLQWQLQPEYAAAMKNELGFQQPRRATPEQQAQTIDEPQAALERLVRIASGDSGQCRIVGNFLLAWWNATEYGGFDLADMWAVDSAIADDMITVFTHIVHCRCYPDSLGYSPYFQIIAERWR